MLWFIVGLVLFAGLFTTNRKRFAIVLFLLFTTIAFQRGFADFKLDVGFDFTSDGGVERESETCGRAVLILFDSDGQLSHLGNNMSRNCEKAARTRVLEGFGSLAFAVVGFYAGWSLIPALTPKPINEALNPLPDSAGEIEGKKRRRVRSD